jgi:hypothetical protein
MVPLLLFVEYFYSIDYSLQLLFRTNVPSKPNPIPKNDDLIAQLNPLLIA